MKSFKQTILEMAFVNGDLTATGGEVNKSSHDINMYKDNEGKEYFVKTPNASLYEYYSDANIHLLVEFLSYEIYRVFGIKVPFVDLYIDENTLRLASETVSGSHVPFTTLPQYKDFVQGFAVDIFLANWDVGGSGEIAGNLLVDDDGNVTRIDPGGALTFRARGKRKLDKFSDNVGEIKSMTDTETSSVARTYNSHLDIVRKSFENFVDVSWSTLADTLKNFNKTQIVEPIIANMDGNTAEDILRTWEREFITIMDKLKSRYSFMKKLYNHLHEDKV